MYSKYTLSNKVRVLLAPLHDTKTVTVLVIFGVGSRYEHKKINGISHFIEHMMFKGTQRRPTTLSISKELDSVGAEYNAYTGKDLTGYYVKINKEHLALALDILSDMLFNSKFDSAELEREKKVICEEIHMYQDNPMMYVDTLLEQAMFPGSSLGWDIAGSDDTVNGMTRDQMRAYIDEYYEPNNVVVGVSGNFEDTTARELIESHFGKTWQATKKPKPFQPFKASSSEKPTVLTHYKETEQVQLALGFPAYHYLHPDVQALNLLTVILGGNMSSRLFINIRERLGLCYYIKASHQPYQDTGNFYVQAGLDKTRIKKAITVILKELKKMRDKGVTKSELKQAKDFISGKMALQLEDSESVVSWYVTQEVMTNKTMTPEEKLESIYQVTSEDVQRVAREIFNENRASLAIIGPYKDEKDFLPLLKM